MKDFLKIFFYFVFVLFLIPFLVVFKALDFVLTKFENRKKKRLNEYK